MNPKKTTEFIKPVAEKNEVSEELVQDITSFFWSETRKSLTELKCNNINVTNLGMFKLRHWKIKDMKLKYEKMLKKYTDNSLTFQRFSIIKELNSRLERLNDAEKFVEEEALKKQSVKQKRYEK